MKDKLIKVKITIKSCEDCPNSCETEISLYKCKKTKREKNIINSITIPEWCPLIKKTKKQKLFEKTIKIRKKYNI
jgi:recombinational DNA repair protein RecR